MFVQNIAIMKILILTITALLSFCNLHAQTINGVPVAEIDAPHVLILGTSKFLSNKVTIQLDFGQEDKVWVAKDTQVKDADGRLTTFNSMVDALNFMSEIGYEFVDAYAITVGNQNVYHWLMRKVEK